MILTQIYAANSRW